MRRSFYLVRLHVDLHVVVEVVGSGLAKNVGQSLGFEDEEVWRGLEVVAEEEVQPRVEFPVGRSQPLM